MLALESFGQFERFKLPGVSLGAGAFLATGFFAAGLDLIVDAVSAFDFLALGASSSTSESSVTVFLFVPAVFVFFTSCFSAAAGPAAVFALGARAGRVDVVVVALALTVEAAFEAAAFFGGIVMVVLVLTRARRVGVQEVLGG
jgi:hypothetical protein